MALDVELLRGSFELVVERNPDLTLRFYEILFERYPRARPLFGRNARGEQAKMLASALAAVLDHLEDASWLASQLGALGARHDAYGVTREMYDWVGDALIRTLAEVAADDWSPALETEWVAAYGAIVALMTAPRAQPPTRAASDEAQADQP